MNTQKHILLLFFVWIACTAYAQKFDNTWLMGSDQDPNPNNGYGINQFTFSDGRLVVSENLQSHTEYFLNNATISDSAGAMVAYFDGLLIENSNYQIMENGADMDVAIVENSLMLQYYSDDAKPQGGLFLPWPGHPDSLLLIYGGDAFIPVNGINTTCLNLSYALIDKKANNGLGKVVAREQAILEDTIQAGGVTAVRHANGRDWWMLIVERNSNRMYRILIDPLGIHVLEQQVVPVEIKQGLAQHCFSPDGNFFAIYSAVTTILGCYLYIAHFDRCTGFTNNFISLNHPPAPRAGGVSISPNSRYLYESHYDTLYQYDLHAPDIFASQELIAVVDSAEFAFRFFLSQLAPDGKIYMVSPHYSMRAIHVIHRPDEKGVACDFVQRGIKLINGNGFSVPNHPNYRLGPLDGSTCDTLGIDNNPVAWYRYEVDTLEPLLFQFHDLSYYEPDSWLWDFGDGNTSTERHPLHLYALPGTYEACLTVSNPNSSHTHCKTIYGVSASENPTVQAAIQVSPNPFHTALRVTLNTTLRSPVFHLYDAMGQQVATAPLSAGITAIQTAHLSTGMYFWVFEAGGERVKAGKVVKF